MSRQCAWPTGCPETAHVVAGRDAMAGLLPSCFSHFIKTGEDWRISMLSADAQGIDWRAPLRSAAQR